MDTQKLDLLTNIFNTSHLDEQVLSRETGYPPSQIRKLVAELIQEGVLRKNNTLESRAIWELKRLKRASKEDFAGNLEILTLIAGIFDIGREDIKNIEPMEKGMTNYSFKFQVNGDTYIMRVPGLGTDEMVSRRNEYNVYKALEGRNLTDDVVYINPKTGYKVTRFIRDTKTCDPRNVDDVRLCMDKLKELHSAKLRVDHEFDIFKKIEYYESLRNGESSIYPDYDGTKRNIYKLKGYIDSLPKKYILTHVDSVSDNFLITGGDVRLIDWEYSGMQDPNLDIAMFSIYASYGKKEVDNLINIYFPDGCKESKRIKIYAYISIGGFLWSNWCEYKRVLGVDFGDYADEQYDYAKEFYKIAKGEIESLEGNAYEE